MLNVIDYNQKVLLMRLEQLMTMLGDDPENSFLHFAIAKEYEKLNELEAALDKYDYILNHDPDYVGLYYHQAKLLEEMGDEARAMDIYVKGIAIATDQKDQHALSELLNAKMNLEIS